MTAVGIARTALASKVASKATTVGKAGTPGVASTASIDDSREGWRTNIAEKLAVCAKSYYAAVRDVPPDKLSRLAAALEAAVFETASSKAEGKPKTKDDAIKFVYIRLASQVERNLMRQVGAFPDDLIGVAYIDGVSDVAATIAAAIAEPMKETERSQILRSLVMTLMCASPHYIEQRDETMRVAKAIEVSCYNASVRASKESERPPRRQWSSQAFVDIYSSRCGTILGMLDPTSSTSQAYGPSLVPRLLSGELAPEMLGTMTEKLICPAATVTERAEIARRSEQKVVRKESNLFRCPHCNERRCTYDEVQRRALDEAPDYICLCLNPQCGRRFTGRG